MRYTAIVLGGLGAVTALALTTAASAAAAPPQESSVAARSGADPSANGDHLLLPRTAGSCLYMLRPTGRYTGEFYVLRKSGTRLTGYTGYLDSEWSNARGTITGSTVRMSIQDPYRPAKWRTTTVGWDRAATSITGFGRYSRAGMLRATSGAIPLSGQTCA